MPEGQGWSEDFATSNPVIDGLHKEMFRRAEVILDKIKAGGVSSDEIKKMIEFLSDYVVEHFCIEEVLQKLYKYPDFEKHKEKHDRFTLEVRVLKDKYETGPSSDIAVELVNLILTRLLDDLEMEDKAFAAYMKEMAA